MKNIMISSRASPQQHPTSPHEAATSRDGETAGGFPAPGAGAFRPPAFGAPGAFPGAPGWGYLRMSLRMQEMYGNGLGPRALQELSQLWGWKMPKWHRFWRHRHHALSPGQAAPFVPGMFPGFALHGGPHGYRSPWFLLFYGSVQISLEVIFGWRAGWLRKGIDWRHVYHVCKKKVAQLSFTCFTRVPNESSLMDINGTLYYGTFIHLG